MTRESEITAQLLAELDALSAEDLSHLAAAKRLRERQSPSQIADLAEWDSLLARLSEPDQSCLDERAQSYLDLLFRVASVAEELALTSDLTDSEIGFGVVKVAVGLGLSEDDAVDAAASGITRAGPR
jgi:hypothetical protein